MNFQLFAIIALLTVAGAQANDDDDWSTFIESTNKLIKSMDYNLDLFDRIVKYHPDLINFMSFYKFADFQGIMNQQIKYD